ncbi:MAG: transferase, partial [Moorea sp. SIO4E2]|nr:transferase [Moorena sp. SIO4E2]
MSIDPSAAISAGVILRADPDSKITIAAGVCIGMGAIIHAHKGTVEVESGASLGAGVLVVGKGKIGANASIGSLTTIWNHSVESLQVVPSASVLGDKGRPLPEESQPTPDSLEQKPQE